MIDLARTSTDPDERADFFEHGAGCREHGVTIGTDWAEMRIGDFLFDHGYFGASEATIFSNRGSVAKRIENRIHS